MKSKEIAREICEELNIIWKDDIKIPVLNGQEITEEDLLKLFDVKCPTKRCPECGAYMDKV